MLTAFVIDGDIEAVIFVSPADQKYRRVKCNANGYRCAGDCNECHHRSGPISATGELLRPQNSCLICLRTSKIELNSFNAFPNNRNLVLQVETDLFAFAEAHLVVEAVHVLVKIETFLARIVIDFPAVLEFLIFIKVIFRFVGECAAV